MPADIHNTRHPAEKNRSSDHHESAPFLNTPDHHPAFELEDVDWQDDGRSQLSDGSDVPVDIDSESAAFRYVEPIDGWLTWPSRTLSFLKSRVLRSRRVTRRAGYLSESKKTPLLRSFRLFRRLTVLFLISLGIFQLATFALGVASAFSPEIFDHAYKMWHDREDLHRSSRWPTDYTADIPPVACHSHNDYWRRVPLISAIKAGCTGVEADVWLFDDDDLYVGHDESSLTSARTLTSLYVGPLLEILERQNPTPKFQTSAREGRNGVFDMDPAQSLVLLIDFKTDYRQLWPVVSVQLEPLREKRYLTHFDGSDLIQGPITVVVTGNAPFEYVVSDLKYRDMFFDAPLDMLVSLADRDDLTTEYNPGKELEYLSQIDLDSSDDVTGPTKQSQNEDQNQNQNQGQGHSGHPPTDPSTFSRFNSHYASIDFQASIGWPRPYLSSEQRDRIGAQVAGAHAAGLKVRYWNVPAWPVGLRNYLWRELVKMGVDFLNVDDLQTAARGDWRGSRSVWDWSLWGGSDW